MVAKKHKSLIDIVKETMEERRVNVQGLSKQTGIPADRIYKWFQKNLSPKVEDADILREWINSNQQLENVPREATRDELGPKYFEMRWYGKIAPNEENYFPLISHKARAGYSRNYENIDYIKDNFEMFPMPPGISPRGADWRWFEVGGKSMFPVLTEGDYLLCSMLPHADWQDIEQYKIYVISWGEEELSVKRIAIDKGDFILISENEEEEGQKRIPTRKVKEIWKVRRRLTAQLPPTKRFKITV